MAKKTSAVSGETAPKGPERKLSKKGDTNSTTQTAAIKSNTTTESNTEQTTRSNNRKVNSSKDRAAKTSLSKNNSEADMNSLSSDKYLPEIPELDDILDMPKNIKEEAFVRAVCTAHKARIKANKKVKQNLSWLHTESEN